MIEKELLAIINDYILSGNLTPHSESVDLLEAEKRLNSVKEFIGIVEYHIRSINKYRQMFGKPDE